MAAPPAAIPSKRISPESSSAANEASSERSVPRTWNFRRVLTGSLSPNEASEETSVTRLRNFTRPLTILGRSNTEGCRGSDSAIGRESTSDASPMRRQRMTSFRHPAELMAEKSCIARKQKQLQRLLALEVTETIIALYSVIYLI